MKYGELLKQVTELVKEEKELEEFKNCLTEAARSGTDVVHISTLEKKFPILYNSGKLWSWCRDNGIGISGSADSNGENADYAFYW